MSTSLNTLDRYPVMSPGMAPGKIELVEPIYTNRSYVVHEESPSQGRKSSAKRVPFSVNRRMRTRMSGGVKAVAAARSTPSCNKAHLQGYSMIEGKYMVADLQKRR